MFCISHTYLMLYYLILFVEHAFNNSLPIFILDLISVHVNLLPATLPLHFFSTFLTGFHFFCNFQSADAPEHVCEYHISSSIYRLQLLRLQFIGLFLSLILTCYSGQPVYFHYFSKTGYETWL